MYKNFTNEAQNILLKSRIEMSNLKHSYVGTEHFILAVLSSNNSLAGRLKKYGLTYELFKKEIIKVIGIGNIGTELFLYTPLLKKILINVLLDSKDSDSEIDVEDIFFSMLDVGEGIAIRIMIGMDIDIEEIYDDFFEGKNSKGINRKSKKLLIDEIGIDMTEKARNDEYDPVIGRDNEISRLLEILLRRTKNNPILVGEAGVGKTAIVEGFSKLIAEGKVPNKLKNMRVISLDMASLVSGTKYRGEFEEKMKRVLNELESNNNIIVFIDEIHTIVGAGGAEGAIDASNIIKPALARGKIRCIGATTMMEYKKFVEKDSALERRFQKIVIEEPDVQVEREILMKLKPIYEKYHHVIIDEEIIDKIILLSEKYIYDRKRPDKVIDILDEVCSKVSIMSNKIDDRVIKIKNDITKIRDAKKSYIIDNEIDKAYNLLKEETLMTSELNKLELESKLISNDIKVSAEDVANIINAKTSIPMYEILQDNVKTISNIKNSLIKKVIGQDKVIDNLIDVTKKIKFGYSDNKCYSMLLVGPTGVGKTMIVKTYAKLMNLKLIRMDMSEYSDSMAINKILGSAAGYVGYDDNKNILEDIRNNQSAIILLDEVDKAHSSVINLFYQILDEGNIRDSKGNVINFSNNIIIMTSNVGFEINNIGFINNDKVLSDINTEFSLPFVNRIDNIIIFNKLDKKSIIKIVNQKIKELKKRYEFVSIEVKDNVILDIVTLSDYSLFGARKIDKLIANKIESVIIDELIKGNKEIVIETSSIKS